MTITFPTIGHSMPEPSKAWTSFKKKLAVVLQNLMEGQYLILLAQPSQRVIQFAAQGSLGMRIETVSNYYLSGVDQLNPAEIMSLVNAGWCAPTGDQANSTPETDPDGSPNFFVQFMAPVPYEAVADLAVRTIVRILGIPVPKSLQYEAFDDEGQQIALPTMGLSSPAQQTNRIIQSFLNRRLSEVRPIDWSALTKLESPLQNDVRARLLVRWALTGVKSKAALSWILPEMAFLFTKAKRIDDGEECLHLFLSFVQARKKRAQAAVKKGSGMIATMWSDSIYKTMFNIESELYVATNALGIDLKRRSSLIGDISRSALGEWEHSFRAAARQDSNRLVRAHLRSLGLPDEPDRLLEGTIVVVQTCVAYLKLDSRSVVTFLAQQQYDPAEVTDAPYQVTFNIYGAAFARISTSVRFEYLDLADLYGAPWDKYKSVGYNQFFVSRTDGAHLTSEEIHTLEDKVTRDLRFDYAEDELNFWFDPDTVDGVLIVEVDDSNEDEE